MHPRGTLFLPLSCGVTPKCVRLWCRAPEQWSEATLTPRTDVWAAAATLTHMLSGAPPFAGLTMAVIVRKVRLDVQWLQGGINDACSFGVLCLSGGD